ncbi:efflux RND transporter periplasmic adaptor subunit [Mesorhizobium sp. RP14(2022)]|uniref:Efflux RND transporter periplasmic adaptor subunit n=1 Tax=Mesorhizobium liriopis TaxID=2953882 RepID=A0ABT1C4B3_9HYPH|nr:efflux RND transporter periplasmic adaptor subunit [Mesorhizobium liriopis]MCO6049627.1 efflux RND transporter periplasmic adaptor subunit [Mesorhizobium liriopis]
MRTPAANDGASSPAAEALDARSLTLLEPALWQRLNAAQDSDELATAWLALQCGMIPGVVGAVVRVAEEKSPAELPLKLLAAWPENSADNAALRETATMARREARPIARTPKPDAPRPTVAYPIMFGDDVVAVVALELQAAGKDELRGAIRQLQWGSAWLRDHLRERRASSGASQLARSRATLELIAAVLDHETFEASAMAAATEMAIRFDCARVSLGFVRRGSSRLAAISHTAQFGRQMALVRAIGSAMDEAIDQRAAILFPIGHDEALATRAHAALARMQHDGQVLTVPLFVVDRFIGAFTFERSRGHAFSGETIRLLDLAATALGPILEEKRRNDCWLITKIGLSLFEQVKRLVGPGHVARKLVVAALIAAGLFFSFATTMDRVNADAELEGSVRRAVVSAYDGYIQEASVRAGEMVEAGQVLATLEDRELSLERLKWATERQQHAFEYDKALASRQPATINVIRAQIDQADAQLAMIDEQIARTRLTAPFDGLVVSGDLSQRVGGSVSRGETLFEIAPLTDYRVIMQVDERRIASLKEGQSGEVVFTALPEESFPVAVDKITPVAETHDGKNMFKVEGSLAGATERLRPGMIGIAKVDVQEELLIWTWLRPAADWMRLAFWRWMP